MLAACSAAAIAVFVLAGVDRRTDGSDGSDHADDPSTTVPVPSAGGDRTVAIIDLPAIWPLPAMNVIHPTAEEAAAAFWVGYLGFEAHDCFVTARTVAEGEAVARICDVDEQEVLVRDDGDRGWVVVGAESGEIYVSSPVVGAAYDVGADIEVSSEPATTAWMRRLGSLEDEGAGCCTPVVFRAVSADGHVIIVENDRTATVRSIVVTPCTALCGPPEARRRDRSGTGASTPPWRRGA